VTAAGAASTLQFSARNDPSQWDLDNISLTASGSSAQVDAIAPTVMSLVASPATANLNAGKTVAFTLAFNENVTVAGGRPTLTLNDGGTATYVSGSGGKTLTFDYTVAAGQNTASLAAAAVHLPSGVTIKDSAGNAANLAGALHSFAGLAVDSPIVTTMRDGSYDVAHFDVKGLSYTSYEDIYNSARGQVAEALDMSSGTGTLMLDANHLLISSSARQLGVTTGSDTFEVNSHTSESIVASGRTAETFEYGSGFGHESITGLLASGPSNDVIEFPVAMFKGLSSRNTATQNWDALVSSGAAVQSGANVSITDAAHDVLTLNNVTTSMLSHYAGSVFKFV
jgi:Bacterial Ig-like domain